MLDLGYVRQNLELVRRKLNDRGVSGLLADFETVDNERRKYLVEAERRKARRNQVSGEIAVLKKQGGDAASLVAEMKLLGAEIDDFDREAAARDQTLRAVLERIPNLPHESVPVGKSAEENVEIRRWGEPRQFEFEPKPHWELGPSLGILDFDRAAKIAGARFAVYAGVGAQLERALANFMLDVHTREHGYTEIFPPFIVNSATLFGTGQLPKFKEDLFKLEGSDYWLIPTAEVPLTNLYAGEVLLEESLPIKLCAWTACFRSEAGSYGKDTRGLIRQHQFQKVELVKLTSPESSYDELESLTRDAGRVLELLGLPYRVVALSTGDLGFSSAKTYDLEVWLPSSEGYREISSCSNCEAFQARRANIRIRRGKGGKTALLHTLNGSGVAIGRTWLAIIENCQESDGSVRVPEVLQPYLGGLQKIIPQTHHL